MMQIERPLRQKQDPWFPWLEIETFFSFPDPENASDGIVCSGGNLSPGMLYSAYQQGVFPWYSKKDPLLWWSPDPRFVLMPGDFHIPSRLKRFMAHSPYTYTMDKAFRSVITHCADVVRPGQKSTWIDSEMIEAYVRLHEHGKAHSFEAWHDSSLVGGFYGVHIGAVFFGESMFALMPDASKSAFCFFAQNFFASGGDLIDCQVYTDHLARFGAKNISRTAFLALEKELLKKIVKIHIPLQKD